MIQQRKVLLCLCVFVLAFVQVQMQSQQGKLLKLLFHTNTLKTNKSLVTGAALNIFITPWELKIHNSLGQVYKYIIHSDSYISP